MSALPNVYVLLYNYGMPCTADLLQGMDAYGCYTLVAWQDSVSPAMLSLAASMGITVYSSDDLPTLENELQLAANGNGVLANDTNADGYSLSAQLMSYPANGQLDFNDDGTFSYTPNPGFLGTDTFTYTATDGMATSTIATVTIIVNPPPGGER